MVVKRFAPLFGIAVVVFVGWGIFMLGNSSKKTNKQAEVVPTHAVSVSPTIMVIVTPTVTTAPAKYSAEFRAIARSKFMTSCEAKYGKEYAANCNCAADYLAKNYTDAVLEKVYVQYHSYGKVTSELQKAYDVCKAN
jgi:hypothetical protein